MAILGMRKLSVRYLALVIGALAGLHLYYYRHSYREAAGNFPAMTWQSSNAAMHVDHPSHAEYPPAPSHPSLEYAALTGYTMTSLLVEGLHTPIPIETVAKQVTHKSDSGRLLPTATQDASLEMTSSPTAATSASSSTETSSTATADEAIPTSMLPCSKLKGAEDVVFVIKTGSTEALAKLPVHFGTTLRCFPHAIIFSDFGEVLSGHQLRDAVGNVSSEVRDEDGDFALWRQLQETGREGLDASQLSTQVADPNSPKFGNGGWQLDKFKNVPMVTKSLEYKSDAKWYIFCDADTYVVWSNLLYWLSLFDHTEVRYLGSAAVIDTQVFAHGGSGYVISNAAMKLVAEEYRGNQTYWDRFAAGHWAGDCVLATLLEKIGAGLTWAFPHIQGGDPIVMDYTEFGYDRRLWCYPVVTYHHILPSTVESLWHLEQAWIKNHTPAEHPLKHSDVFKQWVMPRMADESPDWDNLSPDLIEGIQVTNPEDCRMQCAGISTCLQYSYFDGQCRTSAIPRLGTTNSSGIVSGRMMERLRARVAEWDDCKEGDWITG